MDLVESLLGLFARRARSGPPPATIPYNDVTIHDLVKFFFNVLKREVAVENDGMTLVATPVEPGAIRPTMITPVSPNLKSIGELEEGSEKLQIPKQAALAQAMIVKLIVNEWLEFHGVHFFVPGAAEQPKAIRYIGNDRIPFVPDNKDKRKLVLKYRDIFYEIEFQSRDEVVLFRGPY